jgi:hypothetical protein
MNKNKIIDEIVNELNEDIFTFSELTPQEKEDAYQIFKKSYEDATGKSWDRLKFNQRANNWKFYGVKSKGFIVVRPQVSGLSKMTGVAGDIKAVALGLNDLAAEDKPIWGMADKKIVDSLAKRKNFISPPAIIIKLLLKMIPKGVLSDAPYVVNSDGSITIDYEDVGQATKYFFANKQYFEKMYPEIEKKMDSVPTILKPVIKNFLKFIF